jgi:hypothetical protein
MAIWGSSGRTIPFFPDDFLGTHSLCHGHSHGRNNPSKQRLLNEYKSVVRGILVRQFVDAFHVIDYCEYYMLDEIPCKTIERDLFFAASICECAPLYFI